ncbi:LysR family transcriptional regulator [Pararhizobium polonicum]|uniref:LysR family transcriptional regulator n=1 Tax=Pararhizobium polonicum TaxID=1612624 RepID=UPI0023781FC9|nr:LysR family transcriptional regulator [Pararhizobium polonicum]
MDRLSELEVFRAVVETGGFTATGRRIGASQPVVSKARRTRRPPWGRSFQSQHSERYSDRPGTEILRQDEASA